MNEIETNPTAEWKARRNKVISCGFCPLHRNENDGKKDRSQKLRPKINVNDIE